MNDPELLVSVSSEELEALATGMLAPESQARLNKLIAETKQETLSANEAAELDDMLNKVDQLNLLRAQARYTIEKG